MLTVAKPPYAFWSTIKSFKTERKFGLIKGAKSRVSRGKTDEWDPQALRRGELAQLLDRKWWRRVWIIQEVVLAKNVVIMCGQDHIPWETLGMKLRDGMYTVAGPESFYPMKRTKEGSVLTKFDFHDTDYISLMTLRKKWQAKEWDQSLYNLLYTFRRYESTKLSDHIYAFLGLAKDAKDIDLQPDYSSSSATVFTRVSRALIIAHKHLLLFNLKREPALDRKTTYQASQVYSLLDQSRFFDPHGLIVGKKHKPPREGWVRLSHGWERRRDGSQFRFYNHLTGQHQNISSLVSQQPESPKPMSHWRNLPPGWTKTWDNLAKPSSSSRKLL